MPPIGNSAGAPAKPGGHHLLRDFGANDLAAQEEPETLSPVEFDPEFRTI